MQKFVVAILMLSSLLFLGSAAASSVEVAGGQIVASAIQTGATATGGGTYYNPTGIDIGSDFFLYVMGGNWDHGPDGPCFGDKIFAFKSPYTAAGMYSAFQFVARISPCDGKSYGPGQVFHDGQYRMVADQSDQVNFSSLVLGTSSNGVYWTWQDFIASTNGVQLYAPVLQASTVQYCHCDSGCHCHSSWWGFFPFSSGGTQRTGRMSVELGSHYPRGYRVKILSGGQWLTVNDSTGEFSFTPDNVWPGVVVRSLVWDVDRWELWAHKNVPHNGCSNCTGSYNQGPFGSTFVFREVDTTGWMGPEETVYSAIRCMPADGHVARLFPFRVNDPSGRKLLYSATNDANICTQSPGDNGYSGMQVVVTEVDN